MVIAKQNGDNLSYLYRDRHNHYTFGNSSNMIFSTEEAAINFLHNNYVWIKHNLTDTDKVVVIPYNEKEMME